MENNKQSSVEMMWDEIDNLFPFKDSVEAQKFCALLDKYKAMHKQESISYAKDFAKQMLENKRFVNAEIIYNETFGGNK